MYEKDRVLVAGVYTEVEHDNFMAEPYDTGKELYGFGRNWGNVIYLGYEYHTGVKRLDVKENYIEIGKDESIE